MLKVSDMSPDDMNALLQRESFGHLGCARDGRPYVVPMNYAYDGKELYFFTTHGMKTQFIRTNPQVCLQVEEVVDGTSWRSVMVVGRAIELTLADEMQRAMKLITERNPALAPAITTGTDMGTATGTTATATVTATTATTGITRTTAAITPTMPATTRMATV